MAILHLHFKLYLNSSHRAGDIGHQIFLSVPRIGHFLEYIGKLGPSCFLYTTYLGSVAMATRTLRELLDDANEKPLPLWPFPPFFDSEIPDLKFTHFISHFLRYHTNKCTGGGTSGIGCGCIVPTEMRDLHLLTAVSCRILVTE